MSNFIQPIFVGGTGRSGTTILSKLLNQVESVYTIPQEIRFITDPDGILSLKHALVSDWSKFNSDFAMERFLKLMVHLKTRYKGRYPNHGLAKLVSDEFYESWVREFSHHFIGHTLKSGWAARVNLMNKGLLKIFGKNALTESFLDDSYYCHPQSLDKFNEVSGKFIQSFFNQVAKLNNAEIIVEHTPSNLIHFDFILDAVQHSKLIHIYRDPRDVICSYKTKEWSSSEIQMNVHWIKDVLSQWQLKKKSISTERYIEIAFERMIHSFETEMDKVCNFLGIQFNEKFLEIELKQHNIGRWKHDLDEKEKSILNAELKNILPDYEYTN